MAEVALTEAAVEDLEGVIEVALAEEEPEAVDSRATGVVAVEAGVAEVDLVVEEGADVQALE